MTNLKLIALILVLCLTQSACTSVQVLNDIDIAAEAAATAAPIILAATNIPAPVQALVLGYVSAANAGIGCAATAANAGGTTAQLNAAVLTCLAGLNLAPVLPSGVPQQVAQVVQALAGDIATIINKYGVKSALPRSIAAVAGGPAWKPGYADRHKIAKIQRTVRSTDALIKGKYPHLAGLYPCWRTGDGMVTCPLAGFVGAAF